MVMMMGSNINDNPRVKELLKAYSERRERVVNYIDEMEVLKEQVSSLFPEKLDHRAKYVLEEKIKASASFYASLLALTQEYNKSVVQEIDILRRLSIAGDNKIQDLRDVIKHLESHNPELVEELEERFSPEEQIPEELNQDDTQEIISDE
jgi:4-hydroxyphenylpyruvate dioxygenase-like putative hemolysin